MTGAERLETQGGEQGVSATDADAFRWTVRLSNKEPAKQWVVAFVAIGVLAAGTLLFGDLLLGLVGFAIILAATAEFWLGVSYKLDSRGASARCGLSLTGMEWQEVKRVLLGPDQVKLSPLEQPSKLDPFRGVTLRFSEDNREEVLEKVRRHLPDDVRLLEG